MIRRASRLRSPSPSRRFLTALLAATTLAALPACDKISPAEEASETTRIEQIFVYPSDGGVTVSEFLLGGTTVGVRAQARRQGPNGSQLVTGSDDEDGVYPTFRWSSSDDRVVEVIDDRTSISIRTENDQSGRGEQRLRAVGAGTATITVELQPLRRKPSDPPYHWGNEAPLTAAFQVKVVGPATGVRFEPASPTVQAGQQRSVKIVLVDASGTALPDQLYSFRLFCSTPALATIVYEFGECPPGGAGGPTPKVNGLITIKGVSAGTALFRYELEGQPSIASQFQGTLPVTVTPVASRLEFRPPGASAAGPLDLFVMESKAYPAVAVNAAGTPISGVTGITYRLVNANDANELTINPTTGQVTGTSIAGESKSIPVSASVVLNGQTLVGEGLVQLKSRVDNITLSPTPGTTTGYELVEGESLQLVPTVFYKANAPSTPAAVTVFGMDGTSQVVSITPAGRLTALAPGAAVLRVTAEGVSRTASVVVRPKLGPSSVEIRVATGPTTTRAAASEEPLRTNETLQLRATVKDQNGNAMPDERVTWISANSGVVTVTPEGLVTARGVGRTQVLARSTTNTAVGGVVSFDVTAPPPPTSRVVRILLEPVNAEITAPASVTYTALLYDANGAPTTPEAGGVVQFASTQPVATVTPLPNTVVQARATGVSDGTTTVTARYVLNGQEVASTSQPLRVYAAGSAGHFGSVTISTAGDARSVAVGQDLLFQLILRDVNGNQVSSSSLTLVPEPVTGQTPSSNPFVRITAAPDVGPNMYRIRGLAPTTPGTSTNPLGGAVRVSADGMGVHAEIFVHVRP